MLCDLLLQRGHCVRQNCTLDHPEACTICDGIQLVRPNAAEDHRLSARHLRAAYQKGVVHPKRCTVCNLDITDGQHYFVAHFSGLEHLLNAQNSGASPYVGLMPQAQLRCFPCGRLIEQTSWTSHIAGAKHTRSLRSAPTDARLQPVDEQSWFQGANVQVDSTVVEIDLGHLEPGVASQVFSIRFSLPESWGSASVANVSLTVSTARSFHVTSQPAQVQSGQSAEVVFRFDPAGLAGRVQSDLLVVLRHPTTLQHHAIHHLLSITVSQQAIVEATAPVAPYQRRAPRPPNEARRCRYFGQTVQYRKNPMIKVKLGHYRVPKEIRQSLEGKGFEDQERAISGFLRRATPISDHVKYWRTLLYAEELQMERDMEQFSLEGERLIKDGPYYILQVDGLAERRPSVLLGDEVKLHRTGTNDGNGHVGYVHEIRQRAVALHLNRKFDATARYDVEFVIPRIPLRRMHQALCVAPASLRRVISPTANGPVAAPAQPFTPLDPRLVQNPPQQAAVKSILRLGPSSPPFVVFGPPGTGKTLVVVEAIRQLLRRSGGKILACAPSNFAADEIAKRLVGFGIDNKTIFRLNAVSRDPKTLPPELVPFSFTTENRFDLPPLQTLLNYRIIISTCVSSSLIYATGKGQKRRGHFSHIFVDEAGHALEPEALTPILTMANEATRVVLSGDPAQLGPIARSASALAFDFGKSYLARLMEMPLYSVRNGPNNSVTKLLQNYRSHESILRFPNVKFYDGELETFVDQGVATRYLGWEDLQDTGFPVIFHAVHGQDEQEARSPSFFNRQELSLVHQYVGKLLALAGTVPGDIGIISPYNAQNKKLRQLPGIREHGDDLKAGSVEAFQGQERSIIILSTVRSNSASVSFDVRHSLGFVANSKRLNVAITRARSLLVIVGDPSVLSLDPVWNQFLHYIQGRGGWRGVEFDLPALDEQDDGDGGDGSGGPYFGGGPSGGSRKVASFAKHSYDSDLVGRDDQ